MLTKVRTIAFGMGVVALGAIASCGAPWETIEVPSGTPIMDVLALDLYAPFSRDALLTDPEGTYGPPQQFGSESKGKHYIWFKEYAARIGRVRVYQETYSTDEGRVSSDWLEVYPDSLALENLLRPSYAAHLRHHEKAWKISLRPPNRSWYLTITLNGRAVTQVSDLPGPF
jgi:hypothetical protein